MDSSTCRTGHQLCRDLQRASARMLLFCSARNTLPISQLTSWRAEVLSRAPILMALANCRNLQFLHYEGGSAEQRTAASAILRNCTQVSSTLTQFAGNRSLLVRLNAWSCGRTTTTQKWFKRC